MALWNRTKRAAEPEQWQYPDNGDWPGGVVLNLDAATFRIAGLSFDVTAVRPIMAAISQQRQVLSGYSFELVFDGQDEAIVTSHWRLEVKDIQLTSIRITQRNGGATVAAGVVAHDLGSLKASRAGQLFFESIPQS